MPVVKNDEGTWDFACPKPEGCGADGVSFRSTGWPTKTLAEERGAQHAAEHEAGELMQDLNAFRVERGLIEAAQDD